MPDPVRARRERRLALAALPALALGSVLAAEPAAPGLRLPAGASPVRYAAELWIDPAKEEFRGRIEIRISSKDAGDVLWLNGTDLTIEAASARLAGGAGEAVAADAAAVGTDHVRLHFRRNLPAGVHDVTLDYRGKIHSKDTLGVFREKEGADWYAFTQFEARGARRAFPCFDEPSFKTPWRLTLHVPRGLTAVSNAPVASETDGEDGQRTVVFAPTAPLPSYLVAFGVGPFEVVDAGTAGRRKTPIRILVPRGRSAEARWAAASTGPILEALEAYFDLPYPYEKLDQLAIPVTVGFGAMENAGLVTYASSHILARPSDETAAFRRLWAVYCAHETAHQWFGDDVTLAWWDDTWLNESFASWMEAKIVERWKPEWNVAARRVVERSRAMAADSLVTARRVRQPIVTNDDIENAFDSITYDKGAAVLAMFERWLGEETFRKGVRRYLARHSRGTATADDFIAALGDVTGDPAVPAAFRSFLDQPGVPLVTASLACGEGGARLLLSQRRFLPGGSRGSSGETWRVPVCVRAGDPGAPVACTLLSGPSGSVPLEGPCPARVLANARGGYYRVRYDGDLLGRLLADAGRHLTVEERVVALSDGLALVWTGDVSMAAALALAPPFAADPDRSVVDAARRIVAAPSAALVPDDARPRYEAYVRDVFGARALALGWKQKPGESEDTQLLRQDLVPFVAEEGEEPALVADATALARAWLGNRSAVDGALAASVLSVAARHGDLGFFHALLAEAKKTADRRERARLLGALGSFRDPAAVSSALELTLSPDFDPRESIRILREVADRRETRDRAWTFFKANFERLVERLPRETPATFPWYFAGFADEAHRADVAAFFKDRAAAFLGGPRILAEALEIIQLRTALRAAQEEGVREFLRRREPKPTIEIRPRAGT